MPYLLLYFARLQYIYILVYRYSSAHSQKNSFVLFSPFYVILDCEKRENEQTVNRENENTRKWKNEKTAKRYNDNTRKRDNEASRHRDTDTSRHRENEKTRYRGIETSMLYHGVRYSISCYLDISCYRRCLLYIILFHQLI